MPQSVRVRCRNSHSSLPKDAAGGILVPPFRSFSFGIDPAAPILALTFFGFSIPIDPAATNLVPPNSDRKIPGLAAHPAARAAWSRPAAPTPQRSGGVDKASASRTMGASWGSERRPGEGVWRVGWTELGGRPAERKTPVTDLVGPDQHPVGRVVSSARLRLLRFLPLAPASSPESLGIPFLSSPFRSCSSVRMPTCYREHPQRRRTRTNEICEGCRGSGSRGFACSFGIRHFGLAKGKSGIFRNRGPIRLESPRIGLNE